MENDNYSGSITEGEITHREYIRNTAEINKLGEIGHLRKDMSGDQNVYLLEKIYYG